MERLLDVRHVARLLALSERTVYQMARDGRLPALRVGGRWRFRPSDLRDRLGVSPAAEDARVLWRPPRAEGDVLGRDEFEAAIGAIEDPVERRLAFVALLGRASESLGWLAPVVVGGHAVEFYSAGGYATVDIDLVSAHEPLEAVLPAWGFEPRARHWVHEGLGLVVEAPGSHLGPGQRDRVTRVQVAESTALILSVEDVIVDRLSACVHWGSEEDCRWAAVLMELHAGRIDRAYLTEQARAAEVDERLKALRRMGPPGGGGSGVEDG